MGIWDRIKSSFQLSSDDATNSGNSAAAAQDSNRRDDSQAPSTSTTPTVASVATSNSMETLKAATAEPAETAAGLATQTHAPALIIVHYLDKNGTALKEPEIIAGQIGEPFNWQMAPIPNYALVSVDGLTEDFALPRQTILLRFEKRFGQPVWVYAYDIDARRLLTTPHMLRGRIGSDYNVSPVTFDGYRLMRSVGDRQGEFTTEPKTILFFYRTKDWVKEAPVELYLKMLSEHPVHSAPNPQAKTYPAILPEGAVYRAYRRVETVTDDVWLEIAPSQWVLNDGVLTSQLPLLTATPTNSHVKFKQKIRGTAVIQFVPGKQVHTYREPYGAYFAGVAHDQTVIIDEYLMDDNEIPWYHLENLGYLTAKYLQVQQIDYREKIQG